ncbi:nitrogen regulation protein NR(II) [Paenibacillus sp.]|uniref:two-component system sensor histidine kinase NtrB n=1 Tax=Paenibacillus sp. TaxID=58172 RepID=UPI0035648559
MDHFRDFFDLSLDIMMIIDFNGNLVEVNHSFSRILGENESWTSLEQVFAFLHPDDVDNSALEVQKLIRGQATVSFLNRYRNVEQTYKWIQWTCSVNREAQLIYAIGRDTTGIHIDTYHLLSSMSASIAHEVRNPMTTVKGYLQLLMEKEDWGSYKDTFLLMVSELDRANAIISQYLSLANNKFIEKRQHNLNSIIEYMLPLIESDASKGDVCIIAALGTIPDLMLDEQEIRQLMLNLSRNAIEAMNHGGHLTFKTYTEAEEIILEISDEGEGIPPEVRREIFNPFFTTKETGTGLGLAVSRSIAERHRARLEVKQSGREGTTFVVRFPFSRESICSPGELANESTIQFNL